MSPNANSNSGRALELDHATKAFAGVHALEDVSLELRAGEAHALVGENGAGKSTLVKILGGRTSARCGRTADRGRQVVLAGPAEARDLGIAVIYQEPTLFPDLSVAENVFIGRQPLTSGRRIDRRAMDATLNEIFERLGVRLDPERIARGLSIAEQQLVEIAKALSHEAKVVIMDEPTAALSPVEVKRLFGVVAHAARARHGCAVHLASPRRGVRDLPARDGAARRTARVLDRASTASAPTISCARWWAATFSSADTSATRRGDRVLEVDRLTREGVFLDISFEVHAGEIVALAGLVGAGRSEVARAIFGIDHYDAGSVKVGGRALKRGSPTAAMTAGIGFVPEDRRQHGLVMELSIARNIALASLRRLARGGLLSGRTERSFAADWAKRLQVKYSRITSPVTFLSGGNQQKVVLAKWLSRKPALLIVDEPTRGIDIGTKAEVHRLIASLARDGVAVLVISSELPEVLSLADRILVMHEGRLAVELTHDQATEEAIVAAATGQQSANGKSEATSP